APTATDNCAGTITATTNDPLTYNTQGTYTVTWSYNDGNGNTSTQQQTVIVTSGGAVVTYYADADGDGFGSVNNTIQSCDQPIGYVPNNLDCDDNLLTYADNDGDGFGSTTLVACGVTNSNDCDDNQLQYADNDGDGFGSTTLVACGVTNSNDCDDNQLQYADIDGDGFGSTTLVACGVTNSNDCDDNQLQYADNDNDGFGSTTLVACGVTNSNDCDDNQLQYADNDGDGFGSTTQVACGVTNSNDCDDNLLTYADNDGDGFGSTTLVACGVTNSIDCDDNQLQYADNDGDGFGSTTQVACGVTNSNDCDDNLLTYVDNDGDGFGSTTLVACGVTNSNDCDDNLLTYADNDNDGFGSTTLVACGVTNSNDCNDNDSNQNALTTYYQDADGDTFGNPAVSTQACSQPEGYVTNNTDCNDNNPNSNEFNTYYQDADGDGFGNANVMTQACTQPEGYVTNSTDCNDALLTYQDNDNDGFGSNVLAPCGSINNSDCNDANAMVYPLVLSTIDQNIYTNLVSGAQTYRFRITDTTTGQVQTIDKTLRVFKLTQLTNYAFNKTYNVEVAVRVNNVFGPFTSVACSVVTPVVTTKIQSSQCGITLTNLNTVLYANLVSYATGYRFKITNTNNSNDVQILDRPIRDVRMSLFSNVQNNTTYIIEVAVRNTDGTYLPYGETCLVTTPSTIGKFISTVQKEYVVTVAPNPFVDSFNIKIENTMDEKVSIQVYDLMGRQVENGTFNSNELEKVTLGRDYPTGVYTVILTIGNETKNLRIIKR
ncbi:T9SS type A sorting domain-containing protein, partial [Flavobacterium sp.]|uniref:T9SS type A sorting domain-containing protein n=1 Tax=Flavobacterium sp. TaxID=239 RepID=UPI002B4B30CA